MEYRKNKKKLLLVCDESVDFADVKHHFSREDYFVYHAASGKEALEFSTSVCPDLIVIAGTLHDMDADKVIKEIRTWSVCPIVVMVYNYVASEQVKLLYAGADDYITSTAEEQVINARLYAVMRRSVATGAYKPYKAKQLEINFEKRKILVNGTEIHVSPVEYKILECLAENSGNVVTYQMLLNKIWGPYVGNDSKILRVNMANIRKKIEPKQAEPEYIFTVTRVGYRMIENENAVEVYN